MTMAIARREPNYYIAGFANGRDPSRHVGHRFGSTMGGAAMAPLSITADDSLADAVRKTQVLDFGATDCALPMLDALSKKIPVDCFVILTDSETWAGPTHPAEALRKYRQEMGIPAKLVVVAMVSNGFTIADPEDAGMLDVVGFDSAAPALRDGEGFWPLLAVLCAWGDMGRVKAREPALRGMRTATRIHPLRR